SGLYRPVTTLSYLFNYAILGNADRPLGYHVVNLALHIANVLLLFALLRQFLISNSQFQIEWAAFFAAALWAVHPLSTEAVTNIVGRSDLFAACAVFAGLLSFVRSVNASGARRVAWLAALSVSTFVGVFAKESAIVIAPLVVLAALCLPRTPLTSAGRRTQQAARESNVAERLWSAVPALMAIAPPFVILWIARTSVLG